MAGGGINVAPVVTFGGPSREVRVTDDEVLTIKEIAALLKIGEKTAYSMTQKGELPGFKVRGQWRFRRADILAWIEAQKRTAHMTTSTKDSS